MSNTIKNLEIERGIVISKDRELIVFKKEEESYIFKIYTKAESDEDRKMLNSILNDKKFLRAFISNILSDAILKGIRESVSVLPAERLALVTLYRYLGKRGIKIADLISEEAFEDADKIKDLIQEIMFISYRYPKPVRDFISFLDNLDEFLKEFEENKENRRRFVELSETIEKEILGGKVILSKKEEVARPMIEFELEDGHHLELHMTSTAVKELTGLVLFFRYVLEERDFLIIDEPEMNLHPEAQVKLLEILTSAVNSGLNVILTTHSPYIVDHLTNLMEAYDVRDEISEENLEEYSFTGCRESFISPDKVGVYFFSEEGYIENIFDADQATINWETFSNVSDRTNQIYNKILMLKTNKSKNGSKHI